MRTKMKLASVCDEMNDFFTNSASTRFFTNNPDQFPRRSVVTPN
jgi:hypothetical protein